MPGFVLVGYSATGDDLVAFDTTSGEFLLIAIGTVDFLFSGDKALGSNGGFTHYTGETFLVPLSGFVFHFLGSSFENFTAAIAPGSKLGIVTIAAVDFLRLGTELFVD